MWSLSAVALHRRKHFSTTPSTAAGESELHHAPCAAVNDRRVHLPLTKTLSEGPLVSLVVGCAPQGYERRLSALAAHVCSESFTAELEPLEWSMRDCDLRVSTRWMFRTGNLSQRNITQHFIGLPRLRNDLDFDVDISRGFCKTSLRFFSWTRTIRRK
jgi:hypothetical protein